MVRIMCGSSSVVNSSLKNVFVDVKRSGRDEMVFVKISVDVNTNFHRLS